MSPRSYLPLLAAAALGIAVPAFAQDPQAAEPSPAPAARPRAEAVERNRGGRRDADQGAPARREPVSASQEAQPRSRVVVASSPAPASPALEEQQGGRRNPRSGGGGGGRVSGGGSGPRDGGSVRSGSGSTGGSGDGGRAVPRAGAPRPPRSTYVVPRYGRRYYSGPGGLGYYYYDPWSWYVGYGYGYGWPGYYGSWGGYYGSGVYGSYGVYGGYGGAYGYGRYGGPYGWDIGGLRLKVRPRDAEVYVDGYYAGIVDDFDGVWQQLRLDDGGYHIEIRKPGMRPLEFDIRIQPGRTITYHGDLVSTP